MNTLTNSSVQKQVGFSIIEVLVTLAISGVLFSLALPDFQATIQNNRSTAQASEFMSDLNLARSEAIKRGIRVTLCKSNDESSCSVNGGWEQGWIVFVDNGLENANREADELLLRTHKSLSGGNTLTGINDVDNYISYVANGFSRTVAGAMQIGSLALCDDREDDEQSPAIRINATGRPLLSSVSESAQTCVI